MEIRICPLPLSWKKYSAGRRSPAKKMKKRRKTHNFHQLPKSLEHKKRSRREDFTSSSDFLIYYYIFKRVCGRSARLSFEIKANCLIYFFFHGLVKLLFGLGLYLLGAAVYHALGQGVHQIAALHEIVIEPLAAALFVLPALLCPLVIL